MKRRPIRLPDRARRVATRLTTAKSLRAAGHTLAAIGAALDPPVAACTVHQLLRRDRERRTPFEYRHMAPWLVQQLELARHRQYHRTGSLKDWRAEDAQNSSCQSEDGK